MKFYIVILKPTWQVRYDCNESHVVRAKSHYQARTVAYRHENTLDEITNDEWTLRWLDPKQSTCKLLKQDGPAEVVHSDYHNA